MVHVVAGGPQVAWHSEAARRPASSAAASGSAKGRDSLASKSHVQFSDGMPGAQEAQTSRNAKARTMR